MKLLLVLDQLKDGGAQAIACDLAQGLAASGVDCRIAALHSGARGEDLASVPVHVLGGPPSTLSLPVACARLAVLCRRERPDILHGHAEVADLAGRIVGRALGIPQVSTAHNLRPWNWRPRVGMLLERRTAGLSRMHVAVSESMAAMLRDVVRVPADRIRVIPNWAAPELRPPAPGPLPRQGAPTIIHVARLHAQKRQDILLDAFGEVRRLRPGATLWIVGTGPLEPRLRRLAGEGVEFLGRREDIRHLLRRADIFVLSSDWEGMPLAILEAMGEGLPVVSTAVGGVPELVEDGVTGLLVPKGDSAALARAISACINEPARARAMGEEGRRRCAGRREHGVAEYVRCYQEVLGRPGAADRVLSSSP